MGAFYIDGILVRINWAGDHAGLSPKHGRETPSPASRSPPPTNLTTARSTSAWARLAPFVDRFLPVTTLVRRLGSLIPVCRQMALRSHRFNTATPRNSRRTLSPPPLTETNKPVRQAGVYGRTDFPKSCEASLSSTMRNARPSRLGPVHGSNSAQVRRPNFPHNARPMPAPDSGRRLQQD